MESYVGQVGSVFQNPKTQYFNADSTDELAFPCENVGMPPARIRQRVHDVAERFHVEHLLDRRIVTLSGGQRQQLAVAASTMLAPSLIVMDEPTSNLDMPAIRRLHDMVAGLKADGMTIVIAEHRLAWCADLADRFIVFDHGAIRGEYAASDFRAMPEQRIEELGLRTLDDEPYKLAVHRKLRHAGTGSGGDGRRTVVGVRGLSVGHAKRGFLSRKTPMFVRGIPDFDIHEGEILGLMGPNGAGKSTLARTLCGLASPLDGMVLLDGTETGRNALTRSGFLVMQDVNYQLFSDSVREEALLGLDGMDAEVRGRCDAVLRDLDLSDCARRHPMSLSGGQKQRLAIACALMSDKRFIVLDEPTSGLDRLHMTQVGGLLRKLADNGKAVLVVTHDYELAAQWCDGIIALEDESHDGHGKKGDHFGMSFNVDDWLGDWISFEHLIDSRDPNLVRAWKDSTEAMRSKPLSAIMMRGDARRFWAKACRTSGKERRDRIGGWHIERLTTAGDDDDAAGFRLTWLDEERKPVATHEYRLDHMHDKGLEGKPCYVFQAIDAEASDPFAVLVAMDPMPERSALRHGGLLSHLHFQYASDEGKLVKGKGGGEPCCAIACGIPPCAPPKERCSINATSCVRCITSRHGRNCPSHHRTDLG